MTAEQAAHLIEQFAAQCPFAIWILDRKGVAVFANSKLHEMLGICSRPSGALGMNVLNLPAVKKLELEKLRDALLNGETVNHTLHIENPHEITNDLPITRTAPLTVRGVAFVLKSSRQTVEHFVFFFEDITETTSQHTLLQEQTRDIQTFLRSRDSRKERLEELKRQADAIRKSIRELGYEPEA